MYFKNAAGFIFMMRDTIVIETPDYRTVIKVKDELLTREMFDFECYKLTKLDELTRPFN